MLPPGHFAAGYLTSKLFSLSLLQFYPEAGQVRFLAVGILASVLVDLDDLYAFFKIGRPIAATADIDHRRFFTHAPALHLGMSMVVYGFAVRFWSTDWQLYALFYWLGTWTHFFFDSFGNGIMWLWPASRKLYSFFSAGKRSDVPEKLSTLAYWAKFFREYLRYPPFILELCVIILAFVVISLGF